MPETEEPAQPVPAPTPAELSQTPAVSYFTFTGVQSKEPCKIAPLPKKSRRYRPPGPPFHEKLYGQNGRLLQVTLEIPGPGDECPLTLGPIADDALDFLLPTTTWFTAFPSVKKIALPCGHSFGALSLLYHFARRKMLCPCCRAGLDSPLTILSIPAHFRQTFSAKVNKELRADSAEQNAENARAAAALLHDEGGGLTLLLSLETIDEATAGVTMSVDFFGRDAQDPRATVVVPLMPTWGRTGAAGDGGTMGFTLPGGQLRSLIQEQLRDPTVHEIALSTLLDNSYGELAPARISGRRRVQLGRTENHMVRVIDGGHGTRFHMETTAGDSELVDITWTTPEAYVRRTFLMGVISRSD